MQLVKVQYINYRSLQNVTIEMDPPCRVLVGINEAGKSNVLKGLALLAPDSQVEPDDVRVPSLDEDPIEQSLVRFVFALDRDERLTIFEELEPSMLAKKSTKPILKIDGDDLTLAQVCDSAKHGLYKVDILKNERSASYWKFPDAKILPGWRKPSSACPADFEVTLPDGSSEKLQSFGFIHESALPDDVPEDYTEQLSPDDIYRSIGAGIVEYVDANLPPCIYWHHSDQHLLPASLHIQQFASNPDMCLPLRHMFALAGYPDANAAITDAKATSNGIRNLLDRVAKKATKHIHKIWPEYRGINLDLRENGEVIEAGIKDLHNLYNFDRRSDGFKRFITFLLIVSTQYRTDDLANAVLLHDDTDSGLHPSGAKHLRDEFITISAKNIVVYATHSIFMIDREEIRRHLIVKKDHEITTVTEANASNILDEEVLFNALGISVFEVLKSRNLVFEGWRDKRLFQVALSRVPSAHSSTKAFLKDVGVCHANGTKDIPRITPMLELANRGCLIVSDSDTVAKQHQRNYSGYGDWWRYDELHPTFDAETSEDFVKHDAIVRAVNSVAGSDPDLTDKPDPVLTSDTKVLQQLQQWALANGVATDEVGALLKKVKSKIFADLKPGQVRPEYYELLDKLADELRKIGEAPSAPSAS